MRRLLVLFSVLLVVGVPAQPGSATVLPVEPAAECPSRWCEKVRDVRAVTLRVERGFRVFAKARGEASPMAGSALAMVRAARAEGRSPFLLLSLAGKESTFGLAQHCPKFAGGRWNTTGLGACGREWVSYVFCDRRVSLGARLHSYADGIGVTGMLIRCLLPNARSVFQLYGYCENCPEWMGDVSTIARRYFGSAGGVLWSDAVREVGR